MLCRRHQAIIDSPSDDNEGKKSKYANLVGTAVGGDMDEDEEVEPVQRVDFDPALMFFQDLEVCISSFHVCNMHTHSR